MTVLNRLEDSPPRSAAITIGNFDSVHIGHQRLLKRARELADSGCVGAITFAPLPVEVLNPAAAPGRVGSDAMRAQWLLEAGADLVWMLPFDLEFAAMEPDAFVQRILVEKLNVKHVVVGRNFRYGHRRRGDLETLRAAGEQWGFAVHAIEPVCMDGERISSTRIREALRQGDMPAVQRLLGRPYNISGRVIAGQRLGRELGYPTLNIDVGSWGCLVHGIYAVRVGLCDNGAGAPALPPADVASLYTGVASIGHRPVVRSSLPERSTDGHWLEVHLFDFERECYGMHARVEFVQKLRDEQSFAGIGAMIAQMRRDCDAARKILSV